MVPSRCCGKREKAYSPGIPKKNLARRRVAYALSHVSNTTAREEPYWGPAKKTAIKTQRQKVLNGRLNEAAVVIGLA